MRTFTVASAVVLLLITIGIRRDSLADDVHSLAMQGRQMDAAEKEALEKKLATAPEDIESRTKLLGYYLRNRPTDAGTKSSHSRHVRWFIENAPDSDVLGTPYSQLDKILNAAGYRSVKQAWMKAIEQSPQDAQRLGKASGFFLIHDREIAEDLLRKAQKLEPDNPAWAGSLGQLYSLRMQYAPPGPKRKATAKKAFAQYKLAYELANSKGKQVPFANLAKSAYEAGQLTEAKKYAEEMLESVNEGWNAGNQIHHGNLILGRIALSQGDLAEAKSRLLLAGKTSGSPQLGSFGPNMLLAQELLQQGEKEIVLEYFELCKKFWKSPRRGLERWIEDVKADRTPAFGGNLAY